MTFHDGSPFNAEAAALALDISWSEDYVDGPLIGFKGPDFEATAIDEHILEIPLDQPDPILPNRLWLSPIFSMEQMWVDVGLNVDFEVLDSALYLEQLVDSDRPIPADRNWAVLHQHSNRPADFHATISSWMHCDGPISAWCNDEFSGLADEAESLTGQDRHDKLAERP